jgi:ABC-type glycerol-3-phosphate transport system permease component
MMGNKTQKSLLNLKIRRWYIYIFAIIAILIILVPRVIMLSSRNSHLLTREQVFHIVRDSVGYKEIRSITLTKGGMAGDKGFYFVQLKSGGFIYVPNNDRFRLNYDTDFRLSSADPEKHGKWTEKFLPLEQKEVTLLDFFLYYNVNWMRRGLYNRTWGYPKVH